MIFTAFISRVSSLLLKWRAGALLRMPLAHARKIKQAIYGQYGGEWQGLPAFPEPRDLAHLAEKDWLELIPNARKARALSEITAAFQGVTTRELVERPYGEVQRWLRGIYGIGEWSALFILVRGLGRLEISWCKTKKVPS